MLKLNRSVPLLVLVAATAVVANCRTTSGSSSVKGACGSKPQVVTAPNAAASTTSASTTSASSTSASTTSASSTAAASTAKPVAASAVCDIEVDPLAPRLYRSVDAIQGLNLLPPAAGLPPVFKNLEGVLYCEGKCSIGLSSGFIAMTLSNAVIKGNSAWFPILGANTYLYNPSLLPHADREAVNGPTNYYEVRFDPSNFKHADLIEWYTDTDGTLKEIDRSSYAYSMDLVEDGHWIRHSMSKGVQYPDYDLWQIKDGQGNPTSHYVRYSKAVDTSGTKNVLVLVKADSPEGRDLNPILQDRPANDDDNKGDSPDTQSTSSDDGSDAKADAGKASDPRAGKR